MQTSFLTRLSNDSRSRERAGSEGGGVARTYHFWRGTSSFWFDGAVVSGATREMLYPLMFLLSIGLLSLVFFTMFLPKLGNDGFWLLLAAYSMMLALTLSFFFLTMFTEPGYLPHSNLLRVPLCLETDDAKNKAILREISGDTCVLPAEEVPAAAAPLISEAQVGLEPQGASEAQRELVVSEAQGGPGVSEAQGEAEAQGESEGSFRPPRVRVAPDPGSSKPATLPPTAGPGETAVVGAERPLHLADYAAFCSTCKIFRLERSHHCVRCNACVRMFDHHCMVANNCIGIRNFRYFFGLNVSGLMLTLFFMTSAVLANMKLAGLGTMAYSLVFYAILLQCLFIISFCLFNISIYLFSGQTAKEFFKDVRLSKNPREKHDVLGVVGSLVKFSEPIPPEEVRDFESLEAA